MKTLHDVTNKLLKRREVMYELQNHGNPGVAAVMKDLVAHFKAQEDQIAVKKIASEYGENRFVVTAFIYDSAEAKKKIEPKVKVKKRAEGQ